MDNGVAVTVDPEDVDLAEAHSWHAYHLRPSWRPAPCRKERRFNREFRVFLHREIAVRMRPDLIEKKRKFAVTPLNGDYLDCRRENLAITIRAPHRVGAKGIEPRAKGSVYRPTATPQVIIFDRPASPLWAGGYVYKVVDRRFAGGVSRVRRCIGDRPVD